jgi:(heptosyl)LPS beta-1,4-glucosyltransferase
MLPITVTILTKNEEQCVERCVNSVAWADEILVLDSGSTDRTCQIATSLGAKVVHHDWLGWVAQHQKAIELAQNDWILILDCDEIITPRLANSIQQVMSAAVDDRDGYSMSRRGDFYDILLPNTSPKHRVVNFVRLFNRKYGGYDPDEQIHEEIRVPGKKMILDGDLIHWRGRMMDEYISSFNQYATIEAKVLNDQGVRASGLKVIFRPVLRFLWCYIIHKEIMLGTKGLIHSLLLAVSEYIRYAKLWEIQHENRNIHPSNRIYSFDLKERLKDNSLLKR